MRPILVVEDEPAMRVLIEEYFGILGYPVLTAADAASALEHTAAESISLAFVDINLPDMSGVELIRRLREAGVECPLVVLSGNLRETFADRIVTLRVSEVLEKPIDLDVLEAVIRRLVGPPEGESGQSAA
jgi:two-component system KDP operon response regulator KdpE